MGSSTLAGLLVVGAALTVGCASDPLNDADEVATWVNTGSALAVYSHAHDALSFAEGKSTFPDATCPLTSDDGKTVKITGGCTDSRGEHWVGTATVGRAADGSRALVFDGFAHNGDPDMLSEVTGKFDFHPTAASTHSFDADLVQKGGIETTIRYAGTVVGDFGMATTWNGSGTVERDGLADPTGTVRVSTTNELVDDSVCSGQPVSGQTRIENDDHVAIVTYDGATDCDADKAATWTLDDEDQGRITGITCSVPAPGAGTEARGAALVILAAFGVVCHRRRAARL